MPDLSVDENYNCNEIIQLKKQVNELALGLKAAQKDVESLKIENKHLKTMVENLINKENSYNNVNVTTTSVSDSSKLSTAPKKAITNQINILPCGSPKTTTNQNKTVSLSQTIDISSQSGKNILLNRHRKQCIQINTIKSKLCVISNNKRNYLCAKIEDTFETYDYCHYLIPNGNIQQLLNGIDNKVKSFTKNDHCVIFLGQIDFVQTNNYHDIICFIRETLQTINHTNVTICLPAYRCGHYTTIYDNRVETFNNLLYLDNLTYEYAYLLDSNAELTFDYRMFTKQQGYLNNTGMKTIFTNLKRMITDIDSENNDLNTFASDRQTHSDMFFL